jgi:hypothetical protein
LDALVVLVMTITSREIIDAPWGMGNYYDPRRPVRFYRKPLALIPETGCQEIREKALTSNSTKYIIALKQRGLGHVV